MTEGLAALKVGDEITFSKTVGESDVYGFAGITGDFSRNHVDEQYMSATKYGRRIAHGALLVGYMSTASAQLMSAAGGTSVSYGYDRVRFVRATYIGDTIRVTYRIIRIIPEQNRTEAEVLVTNQHGDVVAAAVHIGKFFESTPDEPSAPVDELSPTRR